MSRPSDSRSRFRLPFRSFFEAVRFLTALPVPGLPPADERTIARSMAAFPLAGLLIGGIGLVFGKLAFWLWGAPFHALAVVAAWIVLTLGLHLDGLADSCDALFSWRPRERKLEIMKDSRIGTMGALGLIFLLGAKIAAIAGMGPHWGIGALIAPVWGRWADIYGIFWFPPAREGGLGRTFHDQVRRKDFAWATLFSLGISGLLWPGWGGLVILLVLPLTHLIAGRMVRALGGLTGDTYGALSELAETSVLLALAGLHHHGLLRPSWAWIFDYSF